MKRIKLYESFESSKKGAFDIFLEVIDELNYKFHNQEYMNTGIYSYFFQTDLINIDMKILDLFEFKKSLPLAYPTLKSIKDKRITFYFAVKEMILEYGFFDPDKELVYKIGEFDINVNYLKSLKNRCIISIKSSLNKSNIRYVFLLNKIKKELLKIFNVEGKIKVLDEFRIKISYDKKLFKDEDLTEDNMNNYINNWLIDNKLYKNYIGHAVITDDNVNIYINTKYIASKTFNTTTNNFN